MKRPILRYHGGKWKLAPWVIRHLPVHRVYVEPFGGGGSVLLRKDRSYAEVYNDQWDIVVNVFRVLRDPITAASLRDALLMTPFSRSEFRECGDVQIGTLLDPVERARRTILRSFAGFGSASTNAAYATGFRSNSNRSGTTPAHDWMHYPGHIERFTERLRGVVIENKYAFLLIPQHDTPQTLFYCDPPYPHETRKMNRGNAAYAFEMTNLQHEALGKLLHSVAGMVVLSGYRCPLYDDLFGNWKSIEREHYADGAKRRTEVLWFNKAAQEAMP